MAGQYNNDLRYQPASTSSPLSVETHLSNPEVPLLNIEPSMNDTSGLPIGGFPSTTGPGSMPLDASSITSGSAGTSTAGSVAASHGIVGNMADELTPFGLLKKSTTAGNFTIANILDADGDESDSEGNQPKEGNDAPPETGHTGAADMKVLQGEGQGGNTSSEGSQDTNDPITQEVVSLSEAQQLYDEYADPPLFASLCVGHSWTNEVAFSNI